MGKHTTKKVMVTIAALNEEKNIAKTIKDCLKLDKFYAITVLVILDSKTTDNTKQIAEKYGARVINTGKWQGKGAALRKAMKYVTGDYVVQIDADYQFSPSEIPKLIKPLEQGFDVALGSRYEKGSNIEEGSVAPFRKFGIFFLSFATSLACSQKVSDILAGFKAFKTHVLQEINFQVSHYGYEAEEVILAARKGYKVINIPISYKKRIEGKSNVTPLKHGFLFLGTIISSRFKKINQSPQK